MIIIVFVILNFCNHTLSIFKRVPHLWSGSTGEMLSLEPQSHTCSSLLLPRNHFPVREESGLVGVEPTLRF